MHHRGLIINFFRHATLLLLDLPQVNCMSAEGGRDLPGRDQKPALTLSVSPSN